MTARDAKQPTVPSDSRAAGSTDTTGWVRRRHLASSAATPPRPVLAGHTGAVLTACLDADRARACERVDRLLARRIPEDLRRAALWHRVSGFLLETIPARPELEALRESLRADQEDASIRHLRALADLRRLAGVLSAADVDWLVFKGPVIAERYYGANNARQYDDVDVLVPRSQFAAALDVLQSSGCAEVEQNWSFMAAEQAGEVQVRGWHGTPLDVHWAPLFTAELRQRFAVDMDSALRRKRAVPIAGIDVPTLDPVDTLLHLCLHAAMEGGHRLAWMKDLERCIAVEQPSWEKVVARASEWQMAAAAGLMLARVKHTLSGLVPDAATRELLGGRTALAVTVAVDGVWPVARASDRGSPSRMLARAAGATWSDTTLRVVQRVSRLRGRNLAEIVRPRLKPARAARLYRQGEGDVTRDGFLASVASDSGVG